MSAVKGLILPFLIGGTIITGVKFTATHIDNPALAAILGGLPTGLISIYFLTSEKSISYAHDYFFVTLSLLTAIMVFYMINVHTKLSKNLILLIALFSWATLIGLRYVLIRRKHNK